MKDLQTYALANPLHRADIALDNRYFRRLKGGWMVGLTANK